MEIRDYNAESDLEGLYRCVVAIQDFERTIVPSMPRGSDIYVEYVKDTIAQCEKFSGKILIASSDSNVIGYATIYTRMISDAIEDGTEEYAYIADLIVLEQYRGFGVGRKLMAAAEAYARESGSSKIRIGVLAENKPAVELYRGLNYRPLAMQLEKHLN